jgi:hypothetical protein
VRHADYCPICIFTTGTEYSEYISGKLNTFDGGAVRQKHSMLSYAIYS